MRARTIAESDEVKERGDDLMRNLAHLRCNITTDEEKTTKSLGKAAMRKYQFQSKLLLRRAYSLFERV